MLQIFIHTNLQIQQMAKQHDLYFLYFNSLICTEKHLYRFYPSFSLITNIITATMTNSSHFCMTYLIINK